MKIKVFTAGGTIDKIYFDNRSKYEVGEPQIVDIFEEANVILEYELESIMKKDSLDLTDRDRQIIYDKIDSDENHHILVTHGTDTVLETAKKLQSIPNKVIVLTGAIEPARSKSSDAPFNVGSAIAALQLLPPGVYLAINGRIFNPNRVKKNLELNRFEET